MKNSGHGSRKAPGNFIRVIAAALIVTATCVVLGAGPAMAADDASTPPDAATGQGLVARILADHALTIGILLVVVAVAMILAYGHHRRSVNRRRSAHARTRKPPAHDRASSVAPVGDPWMSPPPRPAAGQPLHADDYPSWPGRPGPYALHPDHPSWPGRPDPRWVATEAALQADDYPGWPASHSPSWRDAEPPANGGEPGWRGGGPAARREPPPAARRAPLRPPTAAVPAVPVRTGFAPRADAAPRAVITPRPGPVRQESPAGVMARVWPEANWIQPERVQVWDAGSVELATWIISEANQQAADIRHEARDQMAASLADARQEADKLVRRASEQATATLASAELQAAEMRATVTRLSADLGVVATQVTQNLAGFAPPATKPLTRPAGPPLTRPTEQPVATPTAEPVTRPQASPAARPAARPGARPKSGPAAEPGTGPAAEPGTKRAARPGTGPAARPETKPKGRPETKPKGTPRQLVAARVAAVATAALVLFAVAAGTTEVALHGLPFFVFRSIGTGETGPNGLQEDQGPGQPDAPKPTPSRINGQSSPRSTVTLENGQ
jgi:Family of unknown function (DUF6338)